MYRSSEARAADDARRALAHKRNGPAGRRTALALLATVLSLSACIMPMPSQHRMDTRMSVLEDTSEYAIVPASRSYVHAPGALMVLERRLDRATEQRISLRNETTVAGDNQIILRAQTPENADVELFRLEEFLKRFGGAPRPFQSLSDSDLQSGRDQLGPFFYAQQRLGTDTLCVVALRRLSFSARPLPRGTDALDVMMRNCVRGGLDQALAPISPERLAASPANSASGTTGIYTVSPHAAPQGYRTGQ